MSKRELTEVDMRDNLVPMYCKDCSSLLRVGDLVHELFPEIRGGMICKQCNEIPSTDSNKGTHQ